MRYINYPENDIKIDLPDGKKIHGILRGDLKNNKPVIVMMHGRPGSGNELLQWLGAHYLFEEGFNTLRLSMYDFGKEHRDLVECTLDTHISDFDVVVTYLRQAGVKKVFALGHSYGGITILGSKAKLDAAVMWDASHGDAWQTEQLNAADFAEKHFGNLIVCDKGYGFISSKRMEDYDKALGDNSSWAADKKYPIKFIVAEKGIYVDSAKRYFDNADEPKSYVVIKNAHHQFEDSDEVIEGLFTETADWFARFM